MVRQHSVLVLFPGAPTAGILEDGTPVTGRRCFMAKLRVKPGTRAAKPKPGLFRENLRALPCLVIVILGMAIVFYVFYLGLKGN